MVRWQIIGVGAVVAAGLVYAVLRFQHPKPGALPAIRSVADPNPEAGVDKLHPASIEWQKIDRARDGFRVEMPEDVKQIQVPAYTETGDAEQLTMIFANPNAETTFSVAWQDHPPVARSSGQVPGRTLEMARDGALARTQTVLMGESPADIQSFPGRTFEARNSSGGVMNSRLVYTGTRLYMLTASFPSLTARRDRDVDRFFNSFIMTSTPSSGASATGNNGPGAAVSNH